MNKKKDALLKTSSYRNFIRRWDSATYDNMLVRGVEYAVKAVVNAHLQAVGVVKLLELFNEFLAKNDEKKRQQNEDYKELSDKPEEYKNNGDSGGVSYLLPKLFAKDISCWLTEHNKNLIIFLDTYEILKGEEIGKNKIVTVYF